MNLSKIAVVTVITALFTSQFSNITSAEALENCRQYSETELESEIGEGIRLCESTPFQVILDDGSTLTSPEPGSSNSLTTLYIDGAESTTSIALSSDLVLTLRHGLEESATVTDLLTINLIDGGGAGSGDLGCFSSSYALNGYKWTTSYNWYYDNLNESSSRALAAIKSGMRNWTSPVNRCTGATFNTKFRSQYLGLTIENHVATGIESCLGLGDGVNVVGWRQAPVDVLGYTCKSISSSGSYTSADIYFNTLYNSTFYDYPDLSLCGVGDYFLVNTATHEFGHAIGFNHAAADSHQIMAPVADYCFKEKTGLAPGDYSGLLKIYGSEVLYEAV